MGLPPPPNGKLTFKAKKKAGSRGQQNYSSQPKLASNGFEDPSTVSQTADQFYHGRDDTRAGSKKRQSDLDIVSNLGNKLAKKGMIRKTSDEHNAEFTRKDFEEQHFSNGAIKNIQRISKRISHLNQSIDEHQRQEPRIQKNNRYWHEDEGATSKETHHGAPKPHRSSKPIHAKINDQRAVNALNRSPSNFRPPSQERGSNSGEDE